MGNSFGKINDVTFSSGEQLSAAIYLYFTGFDQKCFIGRAMKVRRRNVGRRNEKPQHAKGVPRLFGAYKNMGFLPKRPYHTAVVDWLTDVDGFHRRILLVWRHNRDRSVDGQFSQERLPTTRSAVFARTREHNVCVGSLRRSNRTKPAILITDEKPDSGIPSPSSSTA